MQAYSPTPFRGTQKAQESKGGRAKQLWPCEKAQAQEVLEDSHSDRDHVWSEKRSHYSNLLALPTTRAPPFFEPL